MTASSKLGYVDALRGLAILGVVAVHSSQTAVPANDLLALVMGLGRVGVQLFFVASAFTLCLSWQHRAAQERSPVRNFYVRRLFRIAPLFYLALAGYLLLFGRAASYWAPLGIGWQHIVLSSMFLHGLDPQTFNSPIPGSWSIAAEMMFYLIFPLVIMAAGTVRKTLLMLVASLGIYYLVAELLRLAYAGSAVPHYLVNDFVELNAVAQLPAFFFGILAFRLVGLEMSQKKLIITGLMILVVPVIFLLAPVSILPNRIFCGAVFAILVLLLARWPVSLLVNLATRTLGKFSYGIYLIHFAVIALLEKTGFAHWCGNTIAGVLLFFGTALTISSLAAWVTHSAIEAPMILLGNRFITRLDNGSASLQK